MTRRLQPASDAALTAAGDQPKRRKPCCYRCGWCLELGHTRKRCPKAPKQRHAAHGSSNNAYRANRAAGVCDDCGVPSKTARCPQCSARRKLFPSRDGENPRVRAQRKRWRLAAKRRAARKARR